MRASPRWRAAQAAQTILGLDYDTFMDTVPRDTRLTVIAQYEIQWRIEAIQAWEQRPKSTK